MLHQNSMVDDKSADLALKYRTQIGVRLFILYATVYGIFVVINLVSPLLMERIVLFGMNLAVTYGIGLIVFAIILALIYNRMCAKKEQQFEHAADQKAER